MFKVLPENVYKAALLKYLHEKIFAIVINEISDLMRGIR